MIRRMTAKIHPPKPQSAEPTQHSPDAAKLLSDLHAKGQGLDPQAAKSYVKQVRSDRKRWRPALSQPESERPTRAVP